jgi:hypothetical protein
MISFAKAGSGHTTCKENSPNEMNGCVLVCEQGTLTREDIELAVRKQAREAEEDAMDRAGRRTTDGGGDEDEGPHGEP